MSPCSLEPCASGSTCTNLADGFLCECRLGFTGQLCDIEINECDEEPCLNGGFCTDLINGFECACLPVFSGPECQFEVILCETDSCLNGGTCMEEPGGLSCECAPGYTGETCEEDVDVCQMGLCQNNGTCMEFTGPLFMCVCPQGFTGELCDSEIDFCADAPCAPTANCTSNRAGFECECLPGFSGIRCEVDIDECESNPCGNNGTCLNDINQYICICQQGFTGSDCQTDANECELAPCNNGGVCTDIIGGFICECLTGFTGSTCGDQIDFCADGPCFNSGECTNVLGGFTCNCTTGWSGDRCQYATVEAKLRSCGLNAPVDIFSELSIPTSSEGHVVFTNDSAPIGANFSLGFRDGLYFSAWIWQEEDTAGTVFSYESSSSSVALVSDLNTREVVLYYESSMGSDSATFSAVPIEGGQWHHIAFVVLNLGSVSLAINNDYHISTTAELSVPETITAQIGQTNSFQPGLSRFRGLMRSAALSSVSPESSSAAFDLATLEPCTVECIGGEGYCTNNGQCLDLFGPQRRCSCPIGYTGPFCQYPQHSLSFGGTGFAQLSEIGQSVSSFALNFKTDSPTGELAAVTGNQLELTLQLNSGGLAIGLLSCNSTVSSLSTQINTSLDDLQLHRISLSTNSEESSLSVNLDGEEAHVFNFALPLCTNPTPHPLYLGSNFSGCIQDVEINTGMVDIETLELSGATEFGCNRDTAQFPGAGSYVELPEFVSRDSQAISFEFNTLTTDGIIYFSRRLPTEATGPDPNDFIAIYIDNGEVVFTFNLGEDSQDVTITIPSTVNDGQWHYVRAVQNGTMASLTVDGDTIEDVSAGQLEKLDTTGSVFLGSVPSDSQIESFTGFVDYTGCVRNLEQNGQAVDLQLHTAVQNVHFGTCN